MQGLTAIIFAFMIATINTIWRVVLVVWVLRAMGVEI